ncbi:MAG: hypothetical protein KC423_23665 [Anaerolineales bacterium]|nr:hypothetical protein [Anaerolineales bacterium]
MAEILLQTKLFAPPLRPLAIARPHLIHKLNTGLNGKLTLVSAPAGFGKTTLVSSWLRQCERPFVWLSLDEDDNDLMRFFTYVAAAVQQIQGVSKTLQSLLQATQPMPFKSLATALINDCLTASIPFALTLDDYHVITETAVHEAISFLLDNLPPQLHLVITSRTDPLLPLSRLRARGQMTELRTDDLRFTAQEAADFLQQVMGLKLSAEQVSALGSRTEGWIAGLQMASLSMQGLQSEVDITTFVTDFTGSHRYIFDYLTDEVLTQRPSGTRDFLLQTAVLDRFCASLCEAVTGMNNSQTLLSQLDDANLFIVPLDDQRRWYRYHHLFADLLRQRLKQQDQFTLSQLHLRASHWFQQNGFMPETVQHALAAQAYEQACDLIMVVAPEMLNKGNYADLYKWIEALPDYFKADHSDISIYYAWVLFLMGEIEDAFQQVERIIERPFANLSVITNGRLAALRAYKSHLSQDPHSTQQLALEALQHLGDSDDFFRMRTLILAGHAKLMLGDATGTEDYRHAIQLGQRLNNPFGVFVGTSYLTRILFDTGQRREALFACQRAIEWCESRQELETPLISYAYTELGRLHYEANELEKAERYLHQGLTLSESLGPLAWSNATAKLYLAGLQHIHGDDETAVQTLTDLVETIREANLPEVVVYLELEKMDMLLRIGDVAGAERLIASLNLTASQLQLSDSEKAAGNLIYCRFLVAQNKMRQAITILDQLEEILSVRQWHKLLVHLHLLQACAFKGLGDEKTAVSHLTEAVELAAAENWQRAFLDEVGDFADLLPAVRSAVPAFVDTLKTALGFKQPKPVAITNQLPDPLSEREIEVLSMLATHLSGPEIADHLHISLNTFKTHTKNIYSKLGVKRRNTAVARAQQLGLL